MLPYNAGYANPFSHERTRYIHVCAAARARDSTSTMVPLFNPRTQIWNEHFLWSPDGILIIGLTPIGRATVEALQLNNEVAVEVRRNWVLAGWHHPKE